MGGLCNCLCREGHAMKTTESPDWIVSSEVSHLKSCLRKIDPVQFGINLFSDMFVLYPYTRDWFPNYCTSPADVFRDPNIKAHAVTVIQSIQEFVDHSYDQETLTGLVEKMTKVHLKHCILTVDIEVFWRCFMRQMKLTLGNAFTAKRERAWHKFVAMHCKTYQRLEDEWLQMKCPATSLRPLTKKSSFSV